MLSWKMMMMMMLMMTMTMMLVHVVFKPGLTSEVEC